MDIKKWCQPETTKTTVFEGLYPVTIIAAKTFTKEAEKDGKTIQREIITLTFKTLQAVNFPDATLPADNIVVEQSYYFDVPMHINALNGVARAFKIPQFKSTDDFEGKVGVIGIINREYEDKEGNQRQLAQFGYGLFSYAPMPANPKIEFIANEITGKPTEDEYKEWFKKHLADYKQPK